MDHGPIFSFPFAYLSEDRNIQGYQSMKTAQDGTMAQEILEGHWQKGLSAGSIGPSAEEHFVIETLTLMAICVLYLFQFA